MDIENLREYCLNVPGSEECLPFDDVSLVYKIMGKMFALLPLDSEELCISLKCDPDYAIDLREKYTAVTGAYHFNKKYWNTVCLNKDINDELVFRLIHHSVDEVIKKLTKKEQEKYLEMCKSVI